MFFGAGKDAKQEEQRVSGEERRDYEPCLGKQHGKEDRIRAMSVITDDGANLFIYMKQEVDKAGNRFQRSVPILAYCAAQRQILAEPRDPRYNGYVLT